MKIIIALIGGAASIAAAYFSVWFKNYLDLKKDRRKNAIPMYALEVHEIYTIIGQLKHDLGAERILIMKITNGGGIPTAGCTLYSSVVWESFSKRLGSMRADWNKQVLDEQYISLVSDLFMEKHKVVFVEDPKEGDLQDRKIEEGVLRDLYMAQKISGADFHFIQNSEGITLYLSAQFSGNWDPDSPKHKEAMRIAIGKIKNHVSQMEY